MNWTSAVLILCCLLAIFVVWKEIKRPSKAYLIWRIVASLIAVAALACIILPVNYSKDITATDNHSAVLLTAGFEPDNIGNYKDSKLLTVDRKIAKKYPKVKLIRLDELKADSPVITKLQVLGYGLDENQLNQLGNLPVVFHSIVPNGIISVGWNQTLKAGETLKVQGSYRNEKTKAVRLILKGLSTPLDTVTIAAKATKDFELSTVPKSEGRVVYHLQVIKGKDTIANENLPVQIVPSKPLKILVLSASPDFETRFLKNWLSENGFAVAVRSAISKDKFSSEYVNLPPLKMDKLSLELLDKFDLLIGDLSVLKPESGLLKEAVAQKGLGLVIRADSASKGTSWLQNDFPVEKLNLKEQPIVNLNIKDKKGRSAQLKIDPEFIKALPGTQPLVSDAQNRILVSSAMTGAGRVAFTTVNNTYNWMLAGNKDDYTAFWSMLISNIARKAPVTEEWSVASQLPAIGESVSVRLATASAPGQVSSDHSIIAPNQNPLIPFEWGNIYRPATVGWHNIQQKTGQPAWWYAYGQNDWQGVMATEKIAATRRYTEINSADASVTKAIHKKVQIEVPKIYFYLLLLLACTFLWVEGKLSQSV